jgi:predicted O-linked N-acetylglucosamine transferase (SPINDLY family)
MVPELKDSLQKIIQNFRSRDFEKAESSINQVLNKDSKNSTPILELGISFAKVNQFQEAQIVLECLKHYRKNDLLVLYNLGLIHSAMGNHHQAIENYDDILAINPTDVETLINKGSALIDLQSYELAMFTLQSAINVRSDIPEAWSNLGIAFNSLNLFQDSLNAYDKALTLRPSFYEAWSNKSRPLCKLRRYAEASEACDRALLLHPEYVEGLSNKGNALYELERFEEAIIFFDVALRLRPSYAEAFLNKGHTLFQLGRYVEAISSYVEALLLNPDIDWLYGCLIFAKMKICDWIGIDDYIEKINSKVMLGNKVIDPLPFLALVDDSFLQKKSSEIYIQSQYQYKPFLGAFPDYSKNQKIRVGYFSADFRNHAVSILAVELFELHDKSKFELIAFSFGVDDKSPMRLRLSRAFNQFIDVSAMSDVEIAKLARDLKIDIALDLGGHTAYSRTGIFSYRAAPIQLSYLGYLGTMGAEYYDYLLADRTTIPVINQKFYTEKIVYLPSYQVNDGARSISDKKFTRKELGLPEEGFIFCCFNSSHKILPATFDGWMRLLKAVEGSVLFLYAENELAEKNLKQEAEARCIPSSRLVFGGHLPNDEYLSRYQTCDLFLDTFPYNGGTTASDALWAGLPILTLMGQSFASRMAASLLNAIELPELITATQEEYEATAINLAINPQKLYAIKQKLANNRLSTPLFDTPLFARNIEAAYIQIYQRYQADLLPDHLFIN